MWLFDLLPPSGSCAKKLGHRASCPQLPCITAGQECSRQLECDVMRFDRNAVLAAVMTPPRLGLDECQAEQVLVDEHRNEVPEAVLQCLHVSPNAVIVHLYDLTEEFVKPNAVIALQAGAGGAFHCGVEIYGGEWSYGESGIRCDAPRSQTCHVYKCSIMLGSIDFRPRQVAGILQGLVDTWSGCDYDVLRCNCCSFAQEFCERLGVGPLPPWIDRFARIGGRAVTLGGWMFPSWESSNEIQSDSSSMHSIHPVIEDTVEDGSRDHSAARLGFRGLRPHGTMDMLPFQATSRRHTWQPHHPRSSTPPPRLVSELRHQTPGPRGSSMRSAVASYAPPLPARVGGSVASVGSNRSHGNAPIVASQVRRLEAGPPKKAALGGSVASVGSAASNDQNLIRSSSQQIQMVVHSNSFPLIRGSKIVPTPARTVSLGLGKDPNPGVRRPDLGTMRKE
mmetsp:Transcript_36191/g.57880  ORF Transcript_36191/g.57880 Transcript_36191/m.57880 type:complete len:450 (-) Transcript_36191:86-1435(-)